MARLDPIVREADLPPVEDASRETDVFDCKARYSGDKIPFEIAKDVAAMANRLGGTILVGLSENRKAYVPGTKAEMDKLSGDVDAALKARCFPKPVVGREVIAYKNAGFVLAINVEPFVGVVGVKLLKGDASSKPEDKWDGGSYVFPIRVGSQSDYLTPETLPMYMMPEVRRAVIHLTGALKEEVWLFSAADTVLTGGMIAGKRRKVQGTIEEIDEKFNRFNFSYPGDQGKITIALPIDQVATAWKDPHSWKFYMRGWVVGSGVMEYVPG